jgi:hypothetical protein
MKKYHVQKPHAFLPPYRSDVLHEVPKGVMYEENIGATEDRFGNQQLAVGCHSQLKIWIQDDGGSLRKFATTIEQLLHHAFPALHKDHIHTGPGRASINGIRDQGIKQQLLLGGKKTLEAFMQTLEVEAVKLTVRLSIRFWKTSDRALWRRRTPLKRKKSLPTAYVLALYEHRPLLKVLSPQTR